jgi:putative transposase
MYLPGYTYHVVQRGNNRQACFFDAADYVLYLDLMRDAMHRYGVSIHAYCLMTNHIHLLLTPETTDSISDFSRSVGSRYAQSINKKYLRTGSLWEGRHKSSAVDSIGYLLKCYRYIELNPVVADMVEQPQEYPWSSYKANAWGDKNSLVIPHDCYLELSRDAESRRNNYRELFQTSLNSEDLEAFRKASYFSMPVGSEQFVRQMESGDS